MNPTRINLWSGPRNVSTALMYSFAQRDDTSVFDEPFYAHYLLTTNANHPGREEIINSMENDAEVVINKIILGEQRKPVLFFKQMVHHLVNIDESFIDKTENIFLIRNPEEILSSYSKIISNPTMKDVGIKKQFELFKKLEASGKVSCVIDAKELLLNPQKVLAEVCSKLTIPFTTKMLSWNAGARLEDGIWAKYWYSSVHQSTGFQKYRQKIIALPASLQSLADECKNYYEYLYSKSIKH
ncbi:MAG TPA: hypothetical protein PKA80_05855 [Ignavibacteriaceae bacterium]|nr:hypothetical protein [Ignavibacteriaceae bacterium]